MKTQGNDKILYIKNCLLVITKNKKQLLKLNTHWKKSFFQFLLLKVCEWFVFGQS